jgi:hypothetical protein
MRKRKQVLDEPPRDLLIVQPDGTVVPDLEGEEEGYELMRQRFPDLEEEEQG